MKILVINAGSSSMKYQLVDMRTETVLAKGNCDRIGIDGHIAHKTATGLQFDADIHFEDHSSAFKTILQKLTKGETSVIGDLSEICAVGHRVPHGGEKFAAATVISDEVLRDIEGVSVLAPLHIPACIAAIKACRKILPETVPQVAVFDSSFHLTMPEKAYLYPIPYEYYEQDRVRRYGFHGTSHRYVTGRAAALLGKPADALKIVTCHLGSGSSIAAVDGGRSVDTTMGFTPLAGIAMGTRSGDIDPAIHAYLCGKYGLTEQEFSDILYKKSGLLGLSGLSSDCRDLEQASKDGHRRAQLALGVLAYQIKKYIGAYAAAMGGLDAVVFTGGIGENSPLLRTEICAGLEFLGISVDDRKNDDGVRTDRIISKGGAKTAVLVIPTNEELTIARDTAELVAG